MPKIQAIPFRFSVCRDLCRKHARGLFHASAFLPTPKREAVYAIFAFTRMIREAFGASDDCATPAASPNGSSCCSTGSADQTLSLLRERIDELYDRPAPPSEYDDGPRQVLAAVARAVERYQIPRQYFLDFAEGCRKNLAVSRYATWSALEKQCRLDGGLMGSILGCVLGLSHSDAGRQLATLGVAMRLTSILRDLPADWKRGRLYLPLQDLARFKVLQSDLAAGAITPGFRELMKFQIARARELYRDGAAGICWLEGDGSRLAASVLAVCHADVLRGIERQGFDVFTSAPKIQTMRCLPMAWRLARRRVDDPVPKVFGE